MRQRYRARRRARLRRIRSAEPVLAALVFAFTESIVCPTITVILPMVTARHYSRFRRSIPSVLRRLRLIIGPLCTIRNSNGRTRPSGYRPAALLTSPPRLWLHGHRVPSLLFAPTGGRNWHRYLVVTAIENAIEPRCETVDRALCLLSRLGIDGSARAAVHAAGGRSRSCRSDRWHLGPARPAVRGRSAPR